MSLVLKKSFGLRQCLQPCIKKNRSPSSAIDSNIQEELWLGKKSGYNHMKRFGSVAYVHKDQDKLKPRSVKRVFLNYHVGVKGYKV